MMCLYRHQAQQGVAGTERPEWFDISMHDAIKDDMAESANEGRQERNGPTNGKELLPADEPEANFRKVLSG